MSEDPEFAKIMADCGYTVGSDMSHNELQLVNVARCAWNYQEGKIRDVERRIEIFKAAFESL